MLFIDYGTVCNVPRDTIWFMPKAFSQLPTQAIRARLSNILPPEKNAPWSIDATNRLRELIVGRALVAEIINIDMTVCIYKNYNT